MTTNTLTVKDIEEAAVSLGAEHGKGKDTQVRFMLKLVEAAYFNVVDLTKSKHGTADDAEHYASMYHRASGQSTTFDTKDNNTQKLISCLRTCVKLGSWPKGGNGEPIATVNNLMTIRQKLRKDPTTKKNVEDAANVLLKYARAQLKRDLLIEEAELRQMCFKNVKEAKGETQIIEDMRRKLQRLKTGRGGVQASQPVHITAAINALSDALKAMATKSQPTRVAPTPVPVAQKPGVAKQVA